jgi:hypothetical protein
MGIAVIVEAILSFVGLSLDRHADLGRHDRRGPQIINQALVAAGAADRLHRRSPSSASTCSATASAPRSIPCSGDERAVLDIAEACTSRSAGRAGPVPLLRGVGLAIAAGEVRGLVGESGAGKSMIGARSSGFCRAARAITRGRIDVRGRDLVAMPDANGAPSSARDRADPAGPDDLAQPGQADRRQIGDGPAPHLGMTAPEAARARALDLLAEVAIRDPRRFSIAIRTSFPAACASAC